MIDPVFVRCSPGRFGREEYGPVYAMDRAAGPVPAESYDSYDDASGDTTASAPGCMVLLALMGGGALAGLLEMAHIAVTMLA